MTQITPCRHVWGKALAFLGLLAVLCGNQSAFADSAGEARKSEKTIKAKHFAARGEAKYGDDFEHFEYVNPNAPKGGRIVLSAIGTFDSFNRYAMRGDSVTGIEELYDTLLTASEDEINVFYPLIAESLEYPADYSWVTFHINPNAKDHSGKPITAEDVVFTFEKFMKQGVPQFRSFYKDVEGVEVLDKDSVRFNFKKPNREYISSLASLTILPKHYWQDRDLSEPLSKPPLGTGPYRVGAYEMGQYVTYERIPDYWAADLPSQKGLNNFDVTRYDYYRDTTVALEAFKAGEYDFRQENIAKQWAEEYDLPQIRKGLMVKEELEHEVPPPVQGFIFNTQRELFKDRRVRQALALLLDFEWMNRNLFYDQYKRTYSYFHMTPYMADGEPSQDELAVLEPFREQLPKQVFSEVWVPPETDGSGNVRPQLREAMALLKDAGWELKNRKLVNRKTGRPFKFDLLIYSPTGERVALPYQQNLARLGIDMNVRQVDTTQFLNRAHERDFDMIFSGYSAQAYPSEDMLIAWHSDYIDSTYNQAGVQDPVIDALVEGIAANQQNDEKLLAYGRAFDRVARWNFYLVPHWHSNSYRVAYWNKFSRPDIRPKYALGLNSWWVDKQKSAALKQTK